jgi:hypothetical protein
MEDMLTTEYDGCGRCLVAVRRLIPLTSANRPALLSDLLLRSQQFATLPGRSRAAVSPMCPGRTMADA